MSRSLLSRYIKSIRVKKDFSVEYVSQRAGVTAVEYIRFEELPEKMPIRDTTKFIKALSMDTKEFFYYQFIAFLCFFPGQRNVEDFTNPTVKHKNNLHETDNVLSLQGKREIPDMGKPPCSEKDEC